MNKRRFITVTLIFLIVILVGVLGYVTLVKKPVEVTQITDSQKSENTTPQSTQSNEMENWKTYQDKKHGFEFKYPAKYSSVVSGWGWGDFDIHFLAENGVGMHMVGESVFGNSCNLFLCNGPGKSQLVVDGETWDYLGRQGYTDAGAMSGGRYIYRTTYGDNRLYVEFDQDKAENELIMKSFKFKW